MIKKNVILLQPTRIHSFCGGKWGCEERRRYQVAKKSCSILNCNFHVGAWNYDYSLVPVKDLQMDYENLNYTSVEGIGYMVVAGGKGPSSCCCAVVVLVGTSFAAVGTPFVVAVVVETLMPFAHWGEVQCCWTLQMDHADCNDQMGCYVYPLFHHVHNLHFGVGVVSWHFHLHIDYPVIVCQNHQPDSILKDGNRIVIFLQHGLKDCNL